MFQGGRPERTLKILYQNAYQQGGQIKTQNNMKKNVKRG